MNVQIGKLFIFFGCIFIVAGIFLIFAGKLPGLGRLPGDVYFFRGNLSFYFPIATCVILSVILTLMISLFKLFK